MSQEGANLPQEVEGSHDKATVPHGSIPAGVGSPPTTVMPSGSNSSSVMISKPASAVNNNVGSSSERASPVVLSAAGEDSNGASTTKIAGPMMVLLGGEENKLASPAGSLLAGDKGSDVGAKLASPASKAGSHAAGMDNNNAAQSKLASSTVLHLHAGDGNSGGGSKITSTAVVPHTTGSKSKLDSPPVLHAATKDMDSNAGRPKFTSPVLLHAGEDSKAKTNKLAIQAVPHHVGGNDRSSFRLTRSAAALIHAGKDKDAGSMLAIQVVVPRLQAGKGKNAGSSSKQEAARQAAVDTDGNGSNAKDEVKNSIAREQLAHEANVGGSSGKGNAAAAEDGDHDLHIFTERERRKKMKNMFSTLHGLLPQLPDKADKATIVGEAVTYIKALESTLEKLEKVKLERKRALAAQLVGAGGSSSSHSSSARHTAPALPAPASAALSREAALADMVHSMEVQQATVAAANRALAAAATAGAGGSSSSTSVAANTKRALAAAAAGAGGSSSSSAAALALPHHGPAPFPAAPAAAGIQTWSGHNVVVSVANNEAYINLQCPREPGTLAKALFVLERHRIEVVTTTISAQDGFRMYGIHARANPASSAAEASFPVNLCAEDRFKLAVSEMLQLINL